MRRTTLGVLLAGVCCWAFGAQPARADEQRAGPQASPSQASGVTSASSSVAADVTEGTLSLAAGKQSYGTGGSNYVVKGKAKREPESFAEPLAFAYVLAPVMLAAGVHYSDSLGFDDLSTSSQVAFGAAPFLLPPLVHLGYDDPGGALVAVGGMLYFATLGAVTGGITGYMWESQEPDMPSVWDSNPARRGALIGAGVGYALWALIDIIALSEVPDSARTEPKRKRSLSKGAERPNSGGVGATVAPVMGAGGAGQVGIHGASVNVQGTW